MVRELLDAESARFIELREVKKKTTTTICGQVNAKNAYGAYIGFAPFAVLDSTVVIGSDPDQSIAQLKRRLVEIMCSPASEQAPSA